MPQDYGGSIDTGKPEPVPNQMQKLHRQQQKMRRQQQGMRGMKHLGKGGWWVYNQVCVG